MAIVVQHNSSILKLPLMQSREIQDFNLLSPLCLIKYSLIIIKLCIVIFCSPDLRLFPIHSYRIYGYVRQWIWKPGIMILVIFEDDDERMWLGYCLTTP